MGLGRSENQKSRESLAFGRRRDRFLPGRIWGNSCQSSPSTEVTFHRNANVNFGAEKWEGGKGLGARIYSLGMRKGFLIPLIVLLALWLFNLGRVDTEASDPAKGVANPAVRRAGEGRMLAAQVLLFESRSWFEVEETIVSLTHVGVNTLIVRAFQNLDDRFYAFARPRHPAGVYFETEQAPVVDPLLAKITEIGHKQGLKVFAWMETRKMPLSIPDPEKSQAMRYDFETGNLRPVPMWSIFDSRVEEKLVSLYRDVVRTGIDGILFQDDLIMYHYEDFSPTAVAQFEKETGLGLNPRTLYRDLFRDPKGRWRVGGYSNTFWTWARWKSQKLLELADRLILSAKEINPQIQIALNFTYESVTDPKNSLAWLSQDIEEAKKFPIDFYAIMAYHRQIRKELGLDEAAVYDSIAGMTARLLKIIDRPDRILMKIQIQDWDTQKQIPFFEVDEVLRRITSQGRVSLAFVPYSAKGSLDVIGSHFLKGG